MNNGGDSANPTAQLPSSRKLWMKYATIILLSNIVGTLAVATFLRFLLPGEDARALVEFTPQTAILYATYFIIAIVLGLLLSVWLFAPIFRWLNDPNSEDNNFIRKRVLRLPFLQGITIAVLWLVGVVIFSIMAGHQSSCLAWIVGITIALGGATISLLTFLISDLLLRPVFSVVLPVSSGEHKHMLSIFGRSLLTWLLTSALPIIGILALLYAHSKDYFQSSSKEILPTIIALAATSIVLGYIGTQLVVKSFLDPVQDLHAAITQVKQGNNAAEVEVYDSSEMGELQSGFNDMLRGLRERQRINELFGRYVGTEVAQQAITGQTHLGGELHQVAVLFVDVIGSTGFAATHSPTEVVRELNKYFDTVVDIVHKHKGIINKFEGDAALAVFGAPNPLEDSTSHALASARELHEALSDGVLKCGIGVAAGEVVAGNIGAKDRFEYTVIGDGVNQAARLTDMAKDTPDRVLTTVDTLSTANSAEQKRWVRMKSVELRGRKTMTQLARPVRNTFAEQALVVVEDASSTPASISEENNS